MPASLALWIGRISEGLSRLSGSPPIISLESMRNGTRSYQFDGSKIKSLNFQYTPIREVIQQAADQFLADQAANS